MSMELLVKSGGVAVAAHAAAAKELRKHEGQTLIAKVVDGSLYRKQKLIHVYMRDYLDNFPHNFADMSELKRAIYINAKPLGHALKLVDGRVYPSYSCFQNTRRSMKMLIEATQAYLVLSGFKDIRTWQFFRLGADTPRELKRKYIYAAQEFNCAIGMDMAMRQKRLLPRQIELHHAILHNEIANRKNFPLFIDSIANLYAVNARAHIEARNWRPRVARDGAAEKIAEKVERFLEKDAELARFVNAPTLEDIARNKDKKLINQYKNNRLFANVFLPRFIYGTFFLPPEDW